MLVLALKLFLAPACVVAVAAPDAGGGVAAFFAGVGLLGMLDVSPLVAFAIAVLSLELSRLLVRAPGENGPPALPMPWWTCRRAHCPHCCSSSP